MTRYFVSLFFSLLIYTSYGQDLNPKDFLSKEFHKERREALRKLLPKNSVAVFFANPVRNRANDVDYVYHQDPNFYYLTGYREPHAVLLIFSENQTKEDKVFNETIFVQERNEMAEMWTGKRLGIEGVKERLGFEKVYNGKDFINTKIDFNSYDKVLFFNFYNDVRNSKRNNADLYDLIENFKVKTGYTNELDRTQAHKRAYELIKSTEIESSANVAKVLDRFIAFDPSLKNDEIIVDYQQGDDALRKELREKVILFEKKEKEKRLDTETLGGLMGTLREIKSPAELKLLKKAVDISAVGQIEIMKAMHPNMSETEIQGVHEFVYKKYGAEYEGYPSIVGGGENGCILHYIENNKTKVGNDLVLMDLGAEYHGYTADVTRTIPANGKFSPEQKAIYDLVYEAQEAGIAEAKIGNAFSMTHRAAQKIINEGLVKLGITKSVDERHLYFPHGTSHYIGLDVHDAGNYGPYKANMVITVEPGIYIPEGSACDEKWWGIAVRIEDDILITENGPVNLSAKAPRKSDEIEKLMRESSVLDNFKLPKLD